MGEPALGFENVTPLFPPLLGTLRRQTDDLDQFAGVVRLFQGGKAPSAMSRTTVRISAKPVTKTTDMKLPSALKRRSNSAPSIWGMRRSVTMQAEISGASEARNSVADPNASVAMPASERIRAVNVLTIGSSSIIETGPASTSYHQAFHSYQQDDDLQRGARRTAAAQTERPTYSEDGRSGGNAGNRINGRNCLIICWEALAENAAVGRLLRDSGTAADNFFRFAFFLAPAASTAVGVAWSAFH